MKLVAGSAGVDAYQTYQTSRPTFLAALSAAPVTILARDTALSLGQVSTKYSSRCRPKRTRSYLQSDTAPQSSAARSPVAAPLPGAAPPPPGQGRTRNF